MLTGSLPELVDHRKLASDKVQLDGVIPVASFSRLFDLIENGQGEINVRLQFRKGKKQRSLVVGKASGVVLMTCQNCLEPFEVDVHASIRTLLVDAIEDLMALSQDEDGLVCTDEKVTLVELLEDDLIVSLPMVPKHLPGACAAEAEVAFSESVPGAETRSDETYKPFAGLAEMTKALTQDKIEKE